MEILWEVSTGSPALRVAVIDSGIDITHPDLATAVAEPENERRLPKSCKLLMPGGIWRRRWAAKIRSNNCRDSSASTWRPAWYKISLRTQSITASSTYTPKASSDIDTSVRMLPLLSTRSYTSSM